MYFRFVSVKWSGGLNGQSSSFGYSTSLQCRKVFKKMCSKYNETDLKKFGKKRKSEDC